MKIKILDCARDVYLERGLSGFSMRRISACANISATAIYRHYANKEDLLHNVLLHGFRIFGQYLQRSLAQTGPIAQLRAAGREYARFALENPTYYEVMFMSTGQITGLKTLNEQGAEEMHATFTFLEERVSACMESGDIPSGDISESAMSLWAFCHGMVSLFLAGKIPVDEDGFMALYTERLRNFFQSP